jgi:hypothetical protein
MALNRLLNSIPGSIRFKVFVGTSGFLVFASLPFIFGPQKKTGHRLFDSERPESVQQSIDEAEKIRLSKLGVPKPTEK